MALAAAGEKRTAIELRDITMDDLPFYEQLLLDPAMMAELGGPLPRAGLSDKLRGIVRDVEGGRIWYFTITPEGDPNPAGTVCIWDHPWNGKLINEIGWMIAPGSQGRGLASQAVRSVLAKARAEQRWDVVHAFPGITNGPSNAICRKAGFSKLEEIDFEYAGRPLRCNRWRIDLRGAR